MLLFLSVRVIYPTESSYYDKDFYTLSFKILKTAVKGNVRLQIFPDEMDESPREWDNLGTMVCFHRRYNLGDKHDFTPETISAYVKRTDVVALPVFMYDHSGLSLSTGREYPFDDRWDSMQVGFIYCTLEKAKKEFGDIYMQKVIFGFLLLSMVLLSACGPAQARAEADFSARPIHSRKSRSSGRSGRALTRASRRSRSGSPGR